MISARDPAELAPAARMAELAKLLAAAYLRCLARRRPGNPPEGLDAVAEDEAPCGLPMTDRLATPEARA